ncbi:TraB/GumN family protein [Roseibacterium beibuensis]|uniref:TraB/GumN family protein n=1 Tax=[Roseibacterium] beibuensis TaxID=1193142 RepID=UPI00217E7426|nr:TraB/GumN family protein [Roseibacterium beibuensis]MCS6627195.1 TraB/GumN family protein [Roseibacterium beibuensis]
MTLHRRMKAARAALFAFALLLPTGAPALAQNPVAPAAIPPAEGTGPALWVIRDADSTLYLFGTMHLLRPTTGWGSDRIEQAFASASHLIMEVDSPEDQSALLPLIREHGLSPDRPLSSLLTSAELATLGAAARTMGGSAADMETMRPWLAGVTIQSASIMRAGYVPGSGVEPILKARAQAVGMTVSGFETPDEQIRMLASFPEEGQLAYLRRSLDEFGAAQIEVDRLVEAWASGDVETIRALAVDPMRDTPLLHDVLLVRRNTNWADQIEILLDGSGTAFIAVGALHLAGDDSVQSILRTRGVEVAVAP